MNAFVITVMLIALYLLYHIAFPRQAETKRDNDIPIKEEPDTDDVVVKSRFVRDNRSQAAPSPSTSEKSENQTKKADIFAAGNGKFEAVIPPEKLDEVFGNEPNPDDLDIPPDDEPDMQEVDAEEEAEELRQVLGKDAGPASGFTYEEISEAIDAANSQPEKTGKAAAKVLSGLEKTDMFEQLVSGDKGKALWIKAVIERYEQSILPETTQEDEDSNEYGDFNIADFLS
jgi:hypothetical protein